MLFPLPLTAFENYMRFDDRADQPMVFFLRLSFWGGLNQRAFRLALRTAVERHPLFRAVIRTIDGAACWVSADGIAPRIDWNYDREDESAKSSFLDLTKEPGLRVSVSHVDDQARVLFTFHHCSTDGMGAVRFIEDLLALYTAECSDCDERPRLAPVNTAMLKSRGKFGLNWVQRLMRFPLDLLGVVGIAQFFGHKPAALEMANPPRNTSPRGDQPNFVTRRIPASQLEALKLAARKQGVTVNDLLIRDLLLAIETWNQRHNVAACGNCLRVSVPVNLRQAEDAMLPATNVVSMVFVDRRIKASTCPNWLLKTIRLDTWFVKRFRLALVFNWIIELAQCRKGGFHRLLGGDQPLATTVLSNLGQQFDDLPLGYLGDRVIVGDALLDSIDFMPPIRQGTNAAIGVVTYAGELMVSMQFACDKLTKLVSDDMLRLFDEQLATTAGLPRLATPSFTIATRSALVSHK